MDETRKLILTIIGGLAMMFFLVTNICLPLARNNAKLAKEFKGLRQEEEEIKKFSKEKLDLFQSRIDTAISDLEKRFPPEGNLNLVEHLTRTPIDSEIVFAGITHRPAQERQGYQVSPVEVNMKTNFFDFIKYLSGIEASPLLIGIDNLIMRNFDPETKTLDIRLNFLGYRLTEEFPSISKYMKDRYKSFDELRTTKLLEPIKEVATDQDAILQLKSYNPFVSSYDLRRPLKQDFSAAVETATKTAEIDSLSLKGILHVGEERTALINDTVVREGGRIAGMEVVEIKEHGVILMHSGKRYILKMGVDDDFIKP